MPRMNNTGTNLEPPTDKQALAEEEKKRKKAALKARFANATKAKPQGLRGFSVIN